MNILVVNDDGIGAIGIKKLVQGLKKYGNLTVCAPDQGRSASSHCIILHGSLSFELEKKRMGFPGIRLVECLQIVQDFPSLCLIQTLILCFLESTMD